MKMRGGRGGMNAGNQLNRNTTANASGIRVVVGRGGARTVVPVQRAQATAGKLSERFEQLRSSKAQSMDIANPEAGRKRRQNFAQNKSRAAREELLNQKRGLVEESVGVPQASIRRGRGGGVKRGGVRLSLSARLGPKVNDRQGQGRPKNASGKTPETRRTRPGRGRGAGRGTGRGRGNGKRNAEVLDKQLDAYMNQS